MKKYLLLFCTFFVFAFSLTACKNNNISSASSEPETASAEAALSEEGPDESESQLTVSEEIPKESIQTVTPDIVSEKQPSVTVKQSNNAEAEKAAKEQAEAEKAQKAEAERIQKEQAEAEKAAQEERARKDELISQKQAQIAELNSTLYNLQSQYNSYENSRVYYANLYSQAYSELSAAKSNKERVYVAGIGYTYQVNKSAVAAAQSRVDNYNSQMKHYLDLATNVKTNIWKIQGQIGDLEKEIEELR